MRSRRRSVAALTALGVVSAVGLTSVANFTDAESTPGNHFTAGTLDLTAGPQSKAWTVDNLAPGDVEYRTITVGAAGSLPLDYTAQVTLASQRDGGVLTHPASAANDGLGEIMDFAYRGVVSDEASCSANSAPISTVGAFVVGDDRAVDLGAPSRRLESGSSELLCFSFGLPLQADNAYQGDSADFTLTFNGTQKSGDTSPGETDPGSGPVASTFAVSGVGSDGAVKVNFGAVAGARNYRIVAIPNRGITGSASRVASAGGFVFDGLKNGQAYFFRVFALDAEGTTLATGYGGPVVPSKTCATRPGQVQNLVVKAADRSLTATWDAPVEGPEVSGYTAQVSPDTTNALDRVLDASTRTVTVDDLDPEIDYILTITATSECGLGESTSSSPVAAAVEPGTPGNVTVVSTANGTAQLSFAASTGGSPATSYRVVAVPEEPQTADAGDSDLSFSLAAASTYDPEAPIVEGTIVTDVTQTDPEIKGLDPAKAYTFYVAAKNRAGLSAFSEGTSPTLVATKPAAVTNVRVKPIVGGAEVDWVAGVDTTTSPATRFLLVALDPRGDEISRQVVTDSSATVKGLTNGTRYTFAVVAANAAGRSDKTVSEAVAPLEAPSKVDDLAVAATDTAAALTWKPPSDQPVDEYTITATSAAGPSVKTVITGPANGGSISGLTQKTAYTFSVVPSNDAGTGPASTTTATTAATATTASPSSSPSGSAPTSGPTSSPTSSATASPTETAVPEESAPGTPMNLKAVPLVDGSLTATWTGTAAPAKAKSYQVVLGDADGAPLKTKTTEGTEVTFDGLDVAARYTVTITATNLVGTSSPAHLSDLVAAVKPEPVTLTAAKRDSGALLSWTASKTGGTPVDHYTITGLGADIEVAGDVLEYDVSGLDRDRTYVVSVTATNVSGTSKPGTTTFQPIELPEAVGNLTAIPGDAQVVLSWSASAGASPAKTYRVSGGPSEVIVSGTTAVVPDLINGTPVALTVTPTNSLGDGEAASITVTPRAPVAPAAPTSLKAVPGDHSVALTWSPPSKEAGLKYRVRLLDPSGALVKEATVTELAASFTGLDPAVVHTASVAAENRVGVGEATTTDFRPAEKASAPQDLTAKATAAGSLALTWTPPTSGTAATSYRVTTTPAAGDAVVVTQPSVALAGLEEATKYRITVTPVNAAGDGAPASVEAYPMLAAGGVTNLTAAVGPASETFGSLNLSWTAPTSGGPVDHYVLNTNGGGATIPGNATSYVLTGLDGETATTGTLMAVSKGGNGPETAVPSTYTAVAPAAPTELRAQVTTSGTLALTWTPPTGGTRVSEYSVTVSGRAPVKTTTANTTISGLDPAQAYTFAVTAKNRAGTGPVSADSAPIYPAIVPTAPTSVAATVVEDGVFGVTFTAPTGGSPALEYAVTATPVLPGFSPVTVVSPSATALVEGLVADTAYRISVVARNKAGDGPAAQLLNKDGQPDALYAVLLPGEVSDITGTVDSRTVNLSWTAPTKGGRPTGYRVEASPADGITGGPTRTTAGTKLEFNGLINGTAYTFTVYATNAAGDGPAVSRGTFTPTADPGVVTGLKADPAGTSVALTWAAPAAGGASVKSYTITSAPAAGSLTNPVVVPAASTSYTVNGLVRGASYTFSVVANSTTASGTPSTVKADLLYLAAPATNLTATPVGGSLDLAWSAVADATHDLPASYDVQLLKGTEVVKSATVTDKKVSFSDFPRASYTVSVVARTDRGAAAPTTTTVTAGGYKPTRAANLTVTSALGSNEVVATWSPSLDGMKISAATAYDVRLLSGAVTVKSATVTASTVTFPGVAVGSYVVIVTARNDLGAADESSAPISVVANLPGAPTNLVSPSSGSLGVALTWTAPTSDGGAPILDYEVVATDAGGAKTRRYVGSAATSYTFALDSSKTYTFTVAAVNGSGTGPASGPSTAIKPNDTGNRLYVSGKAGSSGTALGDGSATGTGVNVPTLVDVPGGAVSADVGRYSSCAVNGRVYCWGNNGSGQLGDGTKVNRTVPTAVPSIGSGATAVAVSGSTTCAVVNGGVQCWGDNSTGQLGNNSLTSSMTPVQPVGLESGVTSVVAGDVFFCALKGGAVYCWGGNNYGQIGDGTTTYRPVPTPISSLTSVTKIDAFTLGACAIQNGSVSCWGATPVSFTKTPAAVSGATSGVTDIGAGESNICFVQGGAAKCIGQNNYGQLGNGSTTDNYTTPVQVSGISSGATKIVTGIYSSCAVQNSITKCWGLNSTGQLGNGTYTGIVSTPVTPKGGVLPVSMSPSNDQTVSLFLRSVAAGSVPNTATNLVATSASGSATVAASWTASAIDSTHEEAASYVVRLLQNGVVKYSTTVATPSASFSAVSVGNYVASVVAVNTTGNSAPVIVPVTVSPNLPTAPTGLTIGAATNTSVPLSWTAAGNGGGTLGDYIVTVTDDQGTVSRLRVGSTALTYTVTGLNASTTTYALSVAGVNEAGTGTSSDSVYYGGARVSGTVVGVGTNAQGQLGNGNGTNATTAATKVVGLDGATAVSGRLYHGCAINSAVYCWGYNGYGQLGDGTTNASSSVRNTAVMVPGLGGGATSIASGYVSSCAVLRSAAYCWGLNNFGQLGTGVVNGSTSSKPATVSGMSSGVVSITSGNYHVCALMSDKTVKCWGDNSNGQLGTGTTTASSIPVTVPNLTNVTAVVAGAQTTCAITGGALKCWGANGSGTAGVDYASTSVLAPTGVYGMTSQVTAVSVGTGHACAVQAGALKCWGANASGQLGTGNTTASNRPVAISQLSSGVTSVALGDAHSCAVASGSTKCWGANASGQLGNASTAASTTPVAAPLLVGSNLAAGEGFTMAY